MKPPEFPLSKKEIIICISSGLLFIGVSLGILLYDSTKEYVEKHAEKQQAVSETTQEAVKSLNAEICGKLNREDCIPVDPERLKENVTGYTLIRDAGEINYVRDPDYLLEKDIVGNGLFVSEHMGWTEIFIGRILKGMVEERGQIAAENEQYFSDAAIEQVRQMDWDALDEGWVAEPLLYDRSYTISYLFGDIGYDFTYSFYPNSDKILTGQTHIVTLRLFIDPNGIIRSIDMELKKVFTKTSAITDFPNTKGLFGEEMQEVIVEEGIVYRDKIVYEGDRAGLLSSGDAAVSADEVSRILIDVMESRDGKAAKYKEQFQKEDDFATFQNQPWERLDAGWKANPYYDCYYIDDGSDTGETVFLYNIYPDYEKMRTESADAVICRCSVDISTGKISHTDFRVCTMGKEEYQSAREWTGKQSLIIRDGQITGGGAPIAVSIPKVKFRPNFISSATMIEQNDTLINPSSDKEKVYIAKEIDVYTLGKQLIEDMIWQADNTGEVRVSAKNGWEVMPEYDAYYIAHNEKAYWQQYRYYFYFKKAGEENEKVFVTDVWISIYGIEETETHSYMGRSHCRFEEGKKTEAAERRWKRSDIEAFLHFDWTAVNVLLSDHEIWPKDSGRGWQFSIADMDFDNKPEMLVAMTANHCGGNSLYIYKQEKGAVVPYIDTIATPACYVQESIDYKAISEYMDIDFLDVYVNAENEYRYLSLDFTSFEGDMRGGADTVILYETVLGNDAAPEDAEPKEIAKIAICGTDEEKSLYFLGERVYEAGRLKDMLADYMYGYTKVEMDYNVLQKSFPRKIMGLSEEGQTQHLQELYESMVLDGS